MPFIIKDLSNKDGVWRGKKGELKMVATPTRLLKANIEKMSVCGHATMSMKINGLSNLCHDMYKKEGTWRKSHVEKRVRGVRQKQSSPPHRRARKAAAV